MPAFQVRFAAPADPLLPRVGFFGPAQAPDACAVAGSARRSPVRAAADPDGDDDEELGDEEDLSVAQPLADEDSTFDDFDDEFDDDFEEEENDPDWDHPDEGDAPPPPGKAPGRKK
jgi:hypothetical protein